MMSLNNLISIILPVHNGEVFLENAIKSILNQTYVNFELIIVNDYSSDNSLKIIIEYAKNDKRIVVINNDINIKLPATLNIGHHIAKGDFITWTSHDNILKPNFLDFLLKAIISKQADIVYSNHDIIDENGVMKRVHNTGPIEHILYGNKIGASFLYRKEVFRALNGYDEALFLLEDYDFWLRASSKFDFHHLNENLYQYRLHTDSLTSGIQFNKENKAKHGQGAIELFEKIADVFSWNSKTLNLLTENFLGQPIEIVSYIKESNIIKRDLLKFNQEKFDKTKVVFGLELLLRNHLTTNNCNFKTLVEVLKNDRRLLFNPSFSKKTTFNYILDSLFH